MEPQNNLQNERGLSAQLPVAVIQYSDKQQLKGERTEFTISGYIPLLLGKSRQQALGAASPMTSAVKGTERKNAFVPLLRTQTQGREPPTAAWVSPHQLMNVIKTVPYRHAHRPT